MLSLCPHREEHISARFPFLPLRSQDNLSSVHLLVNGSNSHWRHPYCVVDTVELAYRAFEALREGLDSFQPRPYHMKHICEATSLANLNWFLNFTCLISLDMGSISSFFSVALTASSSCTMDNTIMSVKYSTVNMAGQRATQGFQSPSKQVFSSDYC